LYLKKLEISGFKSFADRTVLNFSPGINTVVGPNGCGKSNILDSIRWVLGEQKTTILRSKQMDEVIFAGTGKRKPSGMASVSILLDNSDKRFPIDKPEVEITRRLYRDGAGQYLLNGRVSRLRDIQESIADTGIGQGALFVLSAREVEQVLSPNSEDRRAILEETAGINKYQLRKKETLQKLNSTRDNVARLNDILQEVANQAESAKKQLAKLERYKKIKERLSLLECRNVMINIKSLDNQEKEIAQKTASLDETRATQDRETGKIQFQLDSSEKERKRAAEILEKEREELSKQSLEENEIRTVMDVAAEKIRQGESAIKELETNQAKLEARKQDTSKRIEENTSRLSEAEKTTTRMELEKEEKKKVLDAEESSFASIRQLIDDDKLKLSRAREDLEIARLKSKHEAEGLSSSRVQKTENEKKALQLMEELEQSDEKIATWDANLEALKTGRDKSAEELKDAVDTLGKNSDELTRSEKRFRELKESLLAIKSELSVMAREEEDFRGFSEAFRFVMKNRDKLPELTPVHTVITVEEQYETAIDITLGGHFQSIITRTRLNANKCVDYLKRERAGRLTFFPLDMDRTGSHPGAMPAGLQGIVGWARDLVACEDLYRDIVDVICGKTLVVKDLDCAYAIYERLKRDRKPVPKMVTIEGDVLEFSGAVTGGKFRQDRSQLLARQRKKKELESLFASKGKDFEKISKDITRMRESTTTLESQKKSLSSKVEQVEKEIRNISGQVQVLRRLKETAQSELTRIEDAELKLKEKIDLHSANIEKLKESLKNLEEAHKTIEIGISEREGSFREQFTGIESARRALEITSTKLEESRRLVLSLKSRLEGDRGLMEQVESDMQNIRERMESKRKEIEVLKEDQIDARNKQSILGLRLKGLKIALESSRQKMAALDNSVEELRGKLASERQKKSSLDEQLNELKIKKIEIDARREYFNESLRQFVKETREAAKKWETDDDKLQASIERTREKLQTVEGVNFSAEDEYNQHMERYNELKTQVDDLQDSSAKLRNIIKDMDTASLKALEETITTLDGIFDGFFRKIFGGGKAGVAFSDPENKLESGIDITVQPPGKRPSSISLLSSGEKSLTAVTFLFALLSIKPSPFVILDELDAPLDESNVEKIGTLIKEFSAGSQFVVITHNRKVMESSDIMFGVTMEELGISRLVSAKLQGVVA
jgi:chromosome segregation protein